jgi:peptide/nickel transport system ATP-binding protein
MSGSSNSSPSATGAPVLEVRDLEVTFATPRGLVRAVRGVSFVLRRGERLGLVGESGSGKTTTALALMRLLNSPGRITGGEAWLDGLDLIAASPTEIRRARFAKIALVPQGAMNSLNPVLTCGAQIEDLLVGHGVRLDRAARATRIAELLEGVGLEPEVAGLFPHQLSGGMKQRICMALAMALGPTVILADEPTSALDVIVQKQVLRTLIAVQCRLAAGVVLVGHDMGLMAQFAHTVGVMYAGRIVEIGPVRALFADPRHPYTRMLIASLPSFERRREFVGIPGVAPSLIDPPSGCAFHPRCPMAASRCAREPPRERVLADGRRVRCHFALEQSDVA